MRRKLLVILVLIAIAVIVAYATSSGKFDWALFGKTLKDMNWLWLIASVVLTYVTYLIRAARWQVLLEPLKKIGLETSMTATLVGFSAIYLLGRAGEPFGALWLTRREHIPFSASGATWVVQRFLDLSMLGIIFGVTLIFLELPAAEGRRQLGFMRNFATVLIIALVAGMIAMVTFRSNIDRIVALVPFKRVAAFLHGIAQGLAFLHERRSVMMTFFHSSLLWIVITLQFWFMILALNLNFSLLAATLVMVAAAIGSVVSIPGVGGGFQVAMVFCLVTFFGVTTERSVVAALVAYALSYLPTLGIAAIYMMLTGLSLKDLRGLETT